VLGEVLTTPHRKKLSILLPTTRSLGIRLIFRYDIKVFEKWVGGGGKGIDWIDLAQDMAGSCEYGTEPSGSIKCGEFLE
jgi:hypothetical protein